MPITSRQQTAIALGCALSVTLLGSGCSSLSNALSGDKIDYRSSGSQSVRLDVPPDLSQLAGSAGAFKSLFGCVRCSFYLGQCFWQSSPFAARTARKPQPQTDSGSMGCGIFLKLLSAARR